MMRLPRIHRRYRTEPSDSRWAIRALEIYLAIWQEVRRRVVDRCMVSMLIAGSDPETRAAADELPKWQGVATEPFSIETIREAVVRILNKPEPPPVQPWISRSRAAQLAAEGIPMALIEKHFAIG